MIFVQYFVFVYNYDILYLLPILFTMETTSSSIIFPTNVDPWAILGTLKQLVQGGSWLTPLRPLIAGGGVLQWSPVVDRFCFLFNQIRLDFVLQQIALET